MKNQTILSTAVLAIAFILLFNSCKKDEEKPDTPPPVANEEELITTMTLTLVDTEGVQPTVIATFRDADGPGGNNPTQFDDINLEPNTVYVGTLSLLNESVDPAEDITEEIADEAVDHLFCYAPSMANAVVTRTDSDGTFEIGLATQWVTGDASIGEITITLKHQPGIKDGTCDPGETDIEVEFQLNVE